MRDQYEERVAEALWDFYRCPTTWRVIQGMPGDDKVLCSCGKSNPAVPAESTLRTGTHIKRFLEKATARDWLVQVDHETRR